MGVVWIASFGKKWGRLVAVPLGADMDVFLVSIEVPFENACLDALNIRCARCG